jgi:hypothetical protein
MPKSSVATSKILPAWLQAEEAARRLGAREPVLKVVRAGLAKQFGLRFPESDERLIPFGLDIRPVVGRIERTNPPGQHASSISPIDRPAAIEWVGGLQPAPPAWLGVQARILGTAIGTAICATLLVGVGGQHIFLSQPHVQHQSSDLQRVVVSPQPALVSQPQVAPSLEPRIESPQGSAPASPGAVSVEPLVGPAEAQDPMLAVLPSVSMFFAGASFGTLVGYRVLRAQRRRQGSELRSLVDSVLNLDVANTVFSPRSEEAFRLRMLLDFTSVLSGTGTIFAAVTNDMAAGVANQVFARLAQPHLADLQSTVFTLAHSNTSLDDPELFKLLEALPREVAFWQEGLPPELRTSELTTLPRLPFPMQRSEEKRIEYIEKTLSVLQSSLTLILQTLEAEPDKYAPHLRSGVFRDEPVILWCLLVAMLAAGRLPDDRDDRDGPPSAPGPRGEGRRRPLVLQS